MRDNYSLLVLVSFMIALHSDIKIWAITYNDNNNNNNNNNDDDDNDDDDDGGDGDNNNNNVNNHLTLATLHR